MSTIDVDSLLAEVSSEEPCGPDMSYTGAYYDLMRSAEGTPEQVVGDSVIEAQEPNWREVRSNAAELCGQTGDLRVVMVLMLAALAQDGVPGLRDGLRLLKGLLERYWDSFHPQLDPDDDNDPLERLNIISSLAAPPDSFGDPMRFQKRLREAPLCVSRQLGRYTLRDVLIAAGELESADGGPDPATIDAAFADTDAEELQATAGAAAEARELMEGIDGWLTEKVGSGRAPNLGSFIGMLRDAERHLAAQLAKRGYGVPTAEGAGEGEVEGAGVQGGAAPVPLTGTIRSPEDVLLALGKVREYYERNEPSSPVPLIIRRAERLVSKNFVDILKDLTPDALNQLKVISGVQSFEETEE